VTARALIEASIAAGLSLDLDGDNLIIETEAEPPAALLAELRRHKAELIAALQIEREERAAIVEHDGGAARTWAEGFARLDPDQPLCDVPPHRWQRFVDDVGLFLDSGFAEQAAALGWGPHDLFGCDSDRPLARVDRAGLLWLLKGDKLVALTADTATIEARAGARLTYRRKPDGEPGRVLAWELGRE
jgi:hypothetical protein